MTSVVRFVATLMGAISISRPVHASPNVSLDDPVYEQLARMRAIGELPAFSGGLLPLTERRVRELLHSSDVASLDEPGTRGLWLRPLERLAARIDLFRDVRRPYSTFIKPRNLVGGVALSCDHQEGRPCGDGAAIASEFDSSAGYADVASASIRLRLVAGSSDYDREIAVDRAYVNAELGPTAIQVGRDVLVLGPSSRTQLGWGRNAPPLDHLRITTAKPFPITSTMSINVDYVLGRLAAPQVYDGNLVSVARAQLDVEGSVEVGMMQLLQLAGEGAPQFGFVEFVLEHLARRDRSTSATDSSNRRVGFDVAVLIESLSGARLYYQLVFEDLRKRFHDALRYDADHLFGVELAAIGPGRRHALMIEVQQTGVRSQEHQPRVTGFTSAARAVGSPLGPDARSIAVQGKLDLGWAAAFPNLELIRFSSDTYTFFDYGPILHTARGPSEFRARLGARLRVPIGRETRLEVDTKFEYVETWSFEPSTTRNNFGGSLSVVWSPRLSFD